VPRSWKSGTGPTGGGILPTTIGAPLTDPWGTNYGYCVWEVGVASKAAACDTVNGADQTCTGVSGGNSCSGGVGSGYNAARLLGSPTPSAGSASSQIVFAVISAGPNRTFNSTCSAYVNSSSTLVTAGGDDIVVSYTYQQAANATSSLWTLSPASAATAVISKDISVGTTLGTVPAAVSGAYSNGIINGAAVVAEGEITSTAGAIGLANVAGNSAQLGAGNCNAGSLGQMYYNTTSNLVDVCTCMGGSCPATGTYSWAPLTTSSSVALNNVTAATADGTLQDSAAHPIIWNWNSLAGGNGLTLGSTSTAAASNTQTLLNIALSGANGTSTQTTYGEQISNTHTGTSSTNVGLYATASGGTNNYAAIFNAGNVGVGTASPSYTLDVEGSSASGTRTYLRNTNAGGFSSFTLGTDAAAIAGALFENGSTAATYGGANALNLIQVQAAPLVFGTSNAVKMTMDSSGNVGIGTAAPGGILDVVAAANKELKVSVPSGYTYPTDFVTGGVALSLSRPGDGILTEGIFSYDTTGAGLDNLGISSRSDIVFLAGSAGLGLQPERMRIQGSTGNVGIGTTTINPWTSSYSVLQLSSSFSVVGGGYPTASIGDFLTENSYIGAGGWTYANTGPASVLALFGGGLSYRVAASGTGGNAITWTNAVAINNSGNVGIGTAAPSNLGSGLTTTVLNVSNASGAGQLSLSDTATSSGTYVGEVTFGTTGASTNQMAGAITSQLTGTSTTSAVGALGFWTNNGGLITQQMAITAAGNVGIGTAAPGNLLTVGSQSGQSNANISARAGNSNSFEWGHANTAGYGSTLGYQNGGGQPYIDFNGEAGTTNNTFKTRGIQSSIILSNLAGGLQFGNVATAAATDNQAFVPLVTMLNSGNVGINNASPNVRLGQHLDVATAANYGGMSLSTWSAVNSDQQSLLDLNRSRSSTIGTQTTVANGDALGGINWRGSDGTNFVNAANIVGYADNTVATNQVPGRLTFGTSNSAGTLTERMRIDSSGNVGIGTAPSYTLDVNGNVHIATALGVGATPGGGGTALNVVGTIGWSAPTVTAGDSYLCYNTGTGYVSRNSSACNASDVRLKKNIHTLENPLDKISLLRGVTFEWKDPHRLKGPQIGLIAQEVEKVFPSIVSAGDDGMKSVSYDKLVAPLVEGVKALKSMLDALVADVRAIQKHLAEYVDPQIAELKAANDNLKADDRKQFATLIADDDKLKAANDNEAAEIKNLTARLDALEAAHH